MAKDFFTLEQQKQIVEAIVSAELNTSGEIRLHLTNNCWGDPKKEAIRLFKRLKMDQTELRNGVLFFLAVKNKKFAIVGDKGINEAVPDDFWDSIRDKMKSHFVQGEFDLGICEGILAVGDKLKSYFPYASDDENELSNEISFD